MHRLYARLRSITPQQILTTLLIVRTVLDIVDRLPPGPVV